MKRVLTALVLIPIVTWVALWASEWLFLAVAATVAFLCFYEYAGLVEGHGIGKPGPPAYIAGLILLLPVGREMVLLAIFAPLMMALAMRGGNLAAMLPEASAAVLGVVYVFGAWKAGVALHTASPYWLFFALVLNWVGDSAAYYAGRAFGKHRLAPRISPKKSVEGSIASVLASMLFGGIFLTRLLHVGIPEALFISAMGNVAGQVGDLAESAIKRGAGVKDSGTLLPGHGGWLDRLDSTLFTMPVVWAWITFK